MVSEFCHTHNYPSMCGYVLLVLVLFMYVYMQLLVLLLQQSTRQNRHKEGSFWLTVPALKTCHQVGKAWQQEHGAAGIHSQEAKCVLVLGSLSPLYSLQDSSPRSRVTHS